MPLLSNFCETFLGLLLHKSMIPKQSAKNFLFAWLASLLSASCLFAIKINDSSRFLPESRSWTSRSPKCVLSPAVRIASLEHEHFHLHAERCDSSYSILVFFCSFACAELCPRMLILPVALNIKERLGCYLICLGSSYETGKTEMRRNCQGKLKKMSRQPNFVTLFSRQFATVLT